MVPLRLWPLLLLVAALVPPPAAHGQISDVWRPERTVAGGTLGVFAAWDGGDADGFYVDLPVGWSLAGADVLRGGYAPVDVRVRRDADAGGRYVVRAGRPLHGPHTLALRLAAGDAAGAVDLTLTPFTGSTPGGATVVTVDVDAEDARGDGQALAFRGGEPVVLGGLPPLGTSDPYTVEFWVQTTGLGEVVFSAWDGDEAQPYPLELVVGAGGGLVFYRGRPGEHQSMTTRRPVADGAWHHVAVVNDPDAGATRLFLDGLAVDSLRSSRPFGVPAPHALAVGGRRGDGAGARAFSGRLDEVRIWRGARRGDALRRTRRQPLPTRVDGDLVLSFDEPLPRRILRAGGDAERVPSSLVFYEPVRRLRAEAVEDGILLSWESGDPRTTAFVVERSPGGDAFEEVGRVRANERGADARWAFTDGGADQDVLFYRIRGVLTTGDERLSATVKLGLGEPAAAARLLGNYPNPFERVTTIAYEVREAGPVRLSVWDVAGVRVAELLDAVREAGRYDVRFDAHELPSGTYFVRLETGGGTHTRTIVRSR